MFNLTKGGKQKLKRIQVYLAAMLAGATVFGGTSHNKVMARIFL